MVDTATQTDSITILDCSTIKYNKHKQPNRRIPETKVQTNITNRNQTKTPIEEKKNRGWPEKRHLGDDKKRFEKTTTERKTSKKSIITI